VPSVSPNTVEAKLKTIIVAEVPGENIFTLFLVEHNLPTAEEVVASIRERINQWAKTPEGQTAYRESSEDFNWGDAAEWLESLKPISGIQTLRLLRADGEMNFYRVNHEELLMPSGSSEALRLD
jgi:hypothetical protein